MTEYELLDRANKLLADAALIRFSHVADVVPLATEALACVALAAELRIRRGEKGE